MDGEMSRAGAAAPAGGRPSFAAVGEGRGNNFDAMRLALAALVVLSHAWILRAGVTEADPLHRLTRGQMDLGALAVDAFFVISGYLITASWLHSRGPLHYLKKRALRIYPGFLVASLVCVLVVAPMAGAHLHDVLGPRHAAESLARMGLLMMPKVPHAFLHAPLQGLNISLWTIRYEFLCYLAVMTLGLSGVLGRRRMVLGLFLVALAAHAAQGQYIVFGGGRNLFVFGHAADWPRLGTYFLAGAVFFLYRDRIPHSRILWAAAVIALVAATLARALWIILPLAGTYVVFGLAFSRHVRLDRFARHGDFSYGLYLWSFPVQQLIIYYFGDTVSPWTVLAGGLVIGMGLAVLSWRYVEQPFLGRKSGHAESQPPRPPRLKPLALPELVPQAA